MPINEIPIDDRSIDISDNGKFNNFSVEDTILYKVVEDKLKSDKDTRKKFISSVLQL